MNICIVNIYVQIYRNTNRTTHECDLTEVTVLYVLTISDGNGAVCRESCKALVTFRTS
jgi:hypothetical protein